MIIHISKEASQKIIQRCIQHYQAFVINDGQQRVLITSSQDKALDPQFSEVASETFIFDSDMQLASRQYLSGTRQIELPGGVTIGGSANTTVFVSGPCSVESEEQIDQVALALKQSGVKILRAGCYKPRTSPYSFQGMAEEGLKILDRARQKHGLGIITEVRDATHIDQVIEFSDIIQIGAKAMYDQGILRRCATIQKPVLLKRGFGTTLQEFVQAAEFILSGGNPNVILCERGIRTFETKTRFTLDLCGVAYLKQYTNLPIFVDPSHAMGYAYGVGDLTRASTAMGVDGLLIESHPNPKEARSDASQQLTLEQMAQLRQSIVPVATAVGRVVV